MSTVPERISQAGPCGPWAGARSAVNLLPPSIWWLAYGLSTNAHLVLLVVANSPTPLFPLICSFYSPDLCLSRAFPVSHSRYDGPVR